MIIKNQLSPKILWVDDDADDAELYRAAFAGLHTQHQLVQVSDGAAALAYLQEQETGQLPSLVVLDINMPVMNGKELLTGLKINPRFRGIPVVMVSTSNSAADKAFCERYHVMIMEKPDSAKGIEQLVRWLVGVAL